MGGNARRLPVRHLQSAPAEQHALVGTPLHEILPRRQIPARLRRRVQHDGVPPARSPRAAHGTRSRRRRLRRRRRAASLLRRHLHSAKTNQPAHTRAHVQRSTRSTHDPRKRNTRHDRILRRIPRRQRTTQQPRLRRRRWTRKLDAHIPARHTAQQTNRTKMLRQRRMGEKTTMERIPTRRSKIHRRQRRQLHSMGISREYIRHTIAQQ